MIQATTPHKRRTWQLALAAFWNFLFQRGFQPLSRPVRIPGRHFAALWSTPLIPDETPSFHGQVGRPGLNEKSVKLSGLMRSCQPPVDSDAVPDAKNDSKEKTELCRTEKKNPSGFLTRGIRMCRARQEGHMFSKLTASNSRTTRAVIRPYTGRKGQGCALEQGQA